MSSPTPIVTAPRRRGRPPCCSREVTALVIHLRRQGLSLSRIAVVLNADGVPTPTGRARWTKSHVDRLLHTQHAKDLIAERSTLTARSSATALS
ncbi:recombinase family protein [Actinomadura sp. CNU-125]|uniref:recombinase family protein n=1 Tax=Actinomadura sp. CNU-125 TaxID=1904961 RepID=UPI0009FB56B7